MTLLSFIRNILGEDKISNPPDEYELIEAYLKKLTPDFKFNPMENDETLLSFKEFQILTSPCIMASYKALKNQKSINLIFVRYTHILSMPRKTIPTEDSSIYLFYLVRNSQINLLNNKDVAFEVVEHQNNITLLRVNKTSYNQIDLKEELSNIFKCLN